MSELLKKPTSYYRPLTPQLPESMDEPIPGSTCKKQLTLAAKKFDPQFSRYKYNNSNIDQLAVLKEPT